MKKISFFSTQVLFIFLIACATKPITPLDDATKPFFGAEVEITSIQDSSATQPYSAILLSVVFPNAPAWKAGFRTGDIIVKINNTTIADSGIKSPSDFRNFFLEKNIGDSLSFFVIRKDITGILTQKSKTLATLGRYQKISPIDYLHSEITSTQLEAKWNLNITEHNINMRLEGRTYGYGEKAPNVTQNFDKLIEGISQKKLISWPDYLNKISDTVATDNLVKRLGNLNESGDSQRPEIITYVQKNPLKLQQTTHWFKENLAKVTPTEPLLNAANLLFDLSKHSTTVKNLTTSKGNPLQELISSSLLSKKILNQAFNSLSNSEFNTLKNSLVNISTRFIEYKFLTSDLSVSEREQLLANLQLMSRINPDYFRQASQILASSLNLKLLNELRNYASSILQKNRSSHWIIKTSLGNVLISGEQNDRHIYRKDKNLFLIIDLGGNDWYGDGYYSIIDFDGSDIYESTQSWIFSAAQQNINFFIDLKGNDTYRARYGSFGASLFGVSLFWDISGDDEYRCMNYCNGVAFGGVAIFVDGSGNDNYQSLQLSQSVAIAGGYGLLIDLEGNDFYYSKGDLGSGYGDLGQYEGWSQGVGIGLRGFISGGLALLYDRSGIDKFESGNFSQGGGYYFGWGLLINDGKEDDTYMSSRYGQGFSAHYALGSLLDLGGNDVYVNTGHVAQGIAWDLSISLLEDVAGNDTYLSCNFCLGVAAESSLATFVDLDGKDSYLGDVSPASDGLTNNYHSGVSVGFFLDLGSDLDVNKKNNLVDLKDFYHLTVDK